MIVSGLRQLALIAGAILVTMPSSMAVDASAWDGDARSGVRLIAGKAPADGSGALRAGVELKLSPGWKTYWRYPGDSGVPPRFDFSRSTNVQSVTVGWPAPHRFSDAAGSSIGYRGGVIFPLRIVPQNASQPVTLRLDLQYAVCEKVCIPVDAKVALAPGSSASSQDAALAAAEAMVPAAAPLRGGKDFAITSVTRDPANKRRVIVDMTAPEHTKVDLFAEGPTPDWALPLPIATPGAPAGQRRFIFDLEGLPPGAKADGAVLTLTAIGESSAIEVKAALD
jgi:DsbC/DsbD-like thiol-disulfide interchange protein